MYSDSPASPHSLMGLLSVLHRLAVCSLLLQSVLVDVLDSSCVQFIHPLQFIFLRLITTYCQLIIGTQFGNTLTSV